MQLTPLIALLWLTACGEPPRSTPAPEPVAEPAPAAAVEPEVAWQVLSPSPLELENEVRKAGIDQSMGDLVPATVPAGVYDDDKDKTALKTGVVFAHALLGGRTSDKAVFLTQVRAMRAGMETIGSGKGLLKTMDKSIEQIQNDTAAREDFLKELDAQVSNSVPEEGWGPSDTTGPLLQAGAWLAGIHIVSQAVVRAEDAEAADKLLKRADVADFFLTYIQGEEGSEKAGGATAKAVAKALSDLKAISSREKVGLEGAKETADVTGKLLQLL